MNHMARPGLGYGLAGLLVSLVSLGFFVLSIYVLYLSIKFLKTGSEAFQIYIDKSKNINRIDENLDK